MNKKQLLQEGNFMAHYHYATAKNYHDVDNPDGALESDGPILKNDSRLIERHIQRLAKGRPVDVVLQDLLEPSKDDVTTQAISL